MKKKITGQNKNEFQKFEAALRALVNAVPVDQRATEKQIKLLLKLEAVDDRLFSVVAKSGAGYQMALALIAENGATRKAISERINMILTARNEGMELLLAAYYA